MRPNRATAILAEMLLTGPVVDRAALHKLLNKVSDLGLPLLSVNRMKSGPADMPGPMESRQDLSRG